MLCEICKQEHRPLTVIAADISEHWESMNYAAKPYLRVMRSLRCPQQMYIFDSGRSIVQYFLANASTFKGTEARRLKTELKLLLSNTKAVY